ncbi:hypothetical protein CHS0354_014417 [Potamilus streckersoni]|uniref:Uncharacterized protein n=1 Tax=Potamilus streckersoni TaxID=2493646 RepID=A0AAE0SA98_9BIVA|nr:hypothetical protein CHS0354_014417 [Potamilus streckersoni]
MYVYALNMTFIPDKTGGLLPADDAERYTLNEIKSDLARCEARQVHLIVDQSYAGEIAVAFQGSSRHKNVVVFASGNDHEYSFDDEYTNHWVQANHKRTCTNEVHEVIECILLRKASSKEKRMFVGQFGSSLNSIKNSSPVMQEGEPGTVRTTIFGAPCNVIPPFTEHELRENYYGCQNLPTGFWLMKAVEERKRR